jgi:hypothetical protein
MYLITAITTRSVKATTNLWSPQYLGLGLQPACAFLYVFSCVEPIPHPRTPTKLPMDPLLQNQFLSIQARWQHNDDDNNHNNNN